MLFNTRFPVYDIIEETEKFYWDCDEDDKTYKRFHSNNYAIRLKIDPRQRNSKKELLLLEKAKRFIPLLKNLIKFHGAHYGSICNNRLHMMWETDYFGGEGNVNGIAEIGNLTKRGFDSEIRITFNLYQFNDIDYN